MLRSWKAEAEAEASRLNGSAIPPESGDDGLPWPLVTFVWHVSPGGTSSRTYEARRIQRIPVLDREPGALYQLDEGERPFELNRVVATSLAVELHSPIIALGDPNKFPEVAWRKRMQELGWTVEDNSAGPPEPW